jgi:hypothetical protein
METLLLEAPTLATDVPIGRLVWDVLFDYLKPFREVGKHA